MRFLSVIVRSSAMDSSPRSRMSLVEVPLDVLINRPLKVVHAAMTKSLRELKNPKKVVECDWGVPKLFRRCWQQDALGKVRSASPPTSSSASTSCSRAQSPSSLPLPLLPLHNDKKTTQLLCHFFVCFSSSSCSSPFSSLRRVPLLHCLCCRSSLSVLDIRFLS